MDPCTDFLSSAQQGEALRAGHSCKSCRARLGLTGIIYVSTHTLEKYLLERSDQHIIFNVDGMGPEVGNLFTYPNS